jgi:hypothetical protein
LTPSTEQNVIIWEKIVYRKETYVIVETNGVILYETHVIMYVGTKLS